MGIRLPALALAVALGAVAACGDSAPTDDEDWGPLAVARGDASGREAGLEGTLRIDDKCVTVETPGPGRVLVVWPSDSTRWDADAKTITYGATDDGSEVVLRSGDEVQVGGGGWAVGEDEGDPAEWAGSTEWVSEPAEECLTDVRFFLGTLQT